MQTQQFGVPFYIYSISLLLFAFHIKLTIYIYIICIHTAVWCAVLHLSNLPPSLRISCPRGTKGNLSLQGAIYVCMYVYTYVCMYVYIYICPHTPICVSSLLVAPKGTFHFKVLYIYYGCIVYIYLCIICISVLHMLCI